MASNFMVLTQGGSYTPEERRFPVIVNVDAIAWIGPAIRAEKAYPADITNTEYTYTQTGTLITFKGGTDEDALAVVESVPEIYVWLEANGHAETVGPEINPAVNPDPPG